MIEDLGSSADAEIVCKAIFGLGRALQLDMITEGIETETQLNLLRSIGYTLGQGYYFSRPIDAEALAAGWLHRPGQAQEARAS